MLGQLRSRGLLYTAGIAFNRIVPEWLFRARITRIDRLGPFEANTDELDSISTYRASTPQEVALIAELTEVPPDRIKDSMTAWGARIDGETVGGLWLATGEFDEPELGLRYRLGDGQAWLFAAQVAKPHRGLGVYRKLLNKALSGTTLQHFVALNPTNRLTLLAHHRAMESKLGSYIAIRILCIAFCITTGSVRRNHTLSWNCRTQPIELSISDTF